MNQTDIDLIKSTLEEKGFEVVCQNTLKQVFQIKRKKDPWEGVEFIRGNLTNKIFKVVNYDGKLFSYFLRDWGNWGRTHIFGKSHFKPSTEAEYVEQLKREAFELYGEIKEGTRFDRSEMGFIVQQTTDVIRNTEKGFNYHKEIDQLLFGDISIYNSGKWAKKLLERVEVHFSNVNVGSLGYGYEFINSKFKAVNHNKVGIFLASQLEKYLNNEITE